MRRFEILLFLILLLVLALLLILPNLKGCSSSNKADPSDLSDSSGSSIASIISRYVTGPSDDGACDFCGAPATMKKRGYEVCQDCYDQAVEYYKNNY